MAALLLLTLAPAPGVDVAPTAAAMHSIGLARAALPAPQGYGAAVYGNGHAYLFGGIDATGASLASIVRYDVANDAVRVMGAQLPSPRYTPSAVWNGTHAFVFGGFGCGLSCDEVVRYDPATDTAVRVAARLPQARFGTTAVWAGGVAFIFGGGDGKGGAFDTVLRYDPATDAVSTMGGRYSGIYASSVWTGSAAYVFGSTSGDPTGIFRYDPVADAVSRVGALPRQSIWSSAIWDGDAAYIFGGLRCSPMCDTILQFRPQTGETRDLCARMPTPRSFSPAVWTGKAAYLLGGTWWGPDFKPKWLDDILRFPPPGNCPPRAVIAKAEALGSPEPAATITAECVNGRATVRLDGTGSSDPDGDPLTYAWTAPGIVFDDPAGAKPAASFPLGSTTVTLAVSDGELGDTTTATVQVVDTLNPTVAITRPTRGHLYLFDAGETALPVNNIVVVGPVTVLADARDQCGVARVRFAAADGQFLVDPEAPYEFYMDTALVGSVQAQGRMRVDAVVTDLGGRTAAASVSYTHIGSGPPNPP